ncbi:MAG: DEAD/DEAH box helicase [Deltaproteobacteria bacterium]|nr:DEAD/DEAH box helicase [Deltaproteobacteria bacterium]
MKSKNERVMSDPMSLRDLQKRARELRDEATQEPAAPLAQLLGLPLKETALRVRPGHGLGARFLFELGQDDPRVKGFALVEQLARGSISKARVQAANEGISALTLDMENALNRNLPIGAEVDSLDEHPWPSSSEVRAWALQEGVLHLVNQRPHRLKPWIGPVQVLSQAQQTGASILELLSADASQREEWQEQFHLVTADFFIVAMRALVQARQEELNFQENVKEALLQVQRRQHLLASPLNILAKALLNLLKNWPLSTQERLYSRRGRRSQTELYANPLRLVYREWDVRSTRPAIDEVVALLEPFAQGSGLHLRQKGPDTEDLRGTAAFAFLEWIQHPPDEELRLFLVQLTQLPPEESKASPLLQALDNALEKTSPPSFEAHIPAVGEGKILTWRLFPGNGKGALDAGLVEVKFGWQKQRGDGSWSEQVPVPLQDLRLGLAKKTSAHDRAIGEQLALSTAANIASHARRDRRKNYKLFAAAAHAMTGHPWVFFKHEPLPMEVHTAPLQLDWAAVTENGEEGIEVRMVVGGEEVDRHLALHQQQELGGIVVLRTQGAYVAQIPVPLLPVVETLCQMQTPFVEAKHAQPLIERLERWTANVSPTALSPMERHQESLKRQAQEIAANEGLVFRLWPTAAGGVQVQVLVRPCPGGPMVAPGEGSERLFGFHDDEASGKGRLVTVRRNKRAELDLADSLMAKAPVRDFFFAEEASETEWSFRFSNKHALQLTAGLEELKAAMPKRVVLLWPEGAEREREKVQVLDVGALKVRISGHRDWFSVEGGASILGDGGKPLKISLPNLLSQLHSHKRFFEVKGENGKSLSVRMTKAMELRLLELEAAVSEEKTPSDASSEEPVLRAFGPGAWMLCDLEDDDWQLETDAGFLKEKEHMQRALSASHEVPNGFLAELRSYQLEGFQWILRLCAWGTGGVLADEMGLGKTVQTLAALLSRAPLGPQLVVAPASVCGMWKKEVARFAPALKVRFFHGKKREETLRDCGAFDLVLTSYEMLARDVELLNTVSFTSAIFDEAQAIKNAHAIRSRAARDLKASFKLAVTGTPVENHLGELWALMRVVSPGLLGSWKRFQSCFALPIEKFQDRDKRALLARKVSPFMLRRTKAEVETTLPPRLERDILVELSPPERQIYDAVQLAIVDELRKAKERARGESKNDTHGGVMVLAGLTRLRLLACDASLDAAAVGAPISGLSAKQKALRNLLEKVVHQGGHVLVFSQFTRILKRAYEQAQHDGHSVLYLDGAIPLEERDAAVQSFQNGEASVFFISLKAGGTGLTLTAANAVVHLDPWWNPAAMDQASDRAHRIGQSREVTVYRLLAKGTVEERILEMHHEKRHLSDGVLSVADGAMRADLRDLERLLVETRLPPKSL